MRKPEALDPQARKVLARGGPELSIQRPVIGLGRLCSRIETEKRSGQRKKEEARASGVRRKREMGAMLCRVRDAGISFPCRPVSDEGKGIIRARDGLRQKDLCSVCLSLSLEAAAAL